MAGEFAAEFPKIAARLELSDFDCSDPYIERLLEGTAFLAARVEKKLDDGYPRFLESILSTISPFSLYPNPSCAILELRADHSNQGDKPVMAAASSAFDATVPGINTPCRFTTMCDSTIYPLRIANVEYLTRDLEKYVPDKEAQSALKIMVEHVNGDSLSSLHFLSLPIFMNMEDSCASDLLRLLTADTGSIYLCDQNGKEARLKSDASCRTLLSRMHNPINLSSRRQLRGLRVLSDFMQFPALYHFFEISCGSPLFDTNKGSAAELIITFKRRSLPLMPAIKSNSLNLNCVPAWNLFPKRADRMPFGNQHEYHIIPDRMAMNDYEVYRVEQIEFFNKRNESLFAAAGFYDDSRTRQQAKYRQNFFSSHRRRSLAAAGHTGRSSYSGSEFFVSFAGDDFESCREELDQFSADLQCTNRDLPLLLHPDAVLKPVNNFMIYNAVFQTPPTRPELPLIRRGAQANWRKVSHINLNISSVLWQPGNHPLDLLKDLIRDYSFRSPEETERMVEGMLSIQTAPKVFRFVRNGGVFFENGWSIRMTLDEPHYAGTGFFLFALILKEVLHSYAPLNSLFEISLYTQQNGFISQWTMSQNL